MCDYEHCDSCGCRVNAKAKMVVESLPCDVASANVGESATLCRRCYGIVSGKDAPVTDDNANPCRCCGEIVYDTDYDTCDTCEETNMTTFITNNTTITTTNDRKNMNIDKTITVTGIKFWNWTITANVIATFNYDPNTNTFSHTQNSIGTNDGDIFGQGNEPSIPNISFSNHVTVDAVRWAKITTDAGMNIGQRDDWIDAIYTSAELNSAVKAELDFLNAAATIVKEDTNA